MRSAQVIKEIWRHHEQTYILYTYWYNESATARGWYYVYVTIEY